MSQDYTKTANDYRAMIKKLKIKADQLESQNQTLKEKLKMPLFVELRVPDFDSEIYVREKILQELKKCCQERGMTLEMLFRCADDEYKNEISIEKFKLFLSRFFEQKVDIHTLQRVALLFDEDSSGTISKDEFYRTLVFAKMNGEDHAQAMLAGPPKMSSKETKETLLNIDRVQEKVLQKFINIVRPLDKSSEEIYEIFDSQKKGFVDTNDFVHILKPAGFDSNEILILMKFFDIRQENKIPSDEFIKDINEIKISNITASALIQMRMKNPGLIAITELRRFSSLLKRFNINPIIVFYQCEPRNASQKKISTLVDHFAKNIPMKKAGITNEQLYRWIKMIDSSNDGIIDQDELRLALITEEDLKDQKQFQQLRTEKQDQQEKIENKSLLNEDMLYIDSEEKFINLILEKMKIQSITLEQFFDWMDINKNGSVSLVELRKGLLALNIQMSDALKILKIFDKNENGVIDVSEFYEAFGPAFYQEGLKIITKRSAQKLDALFKQNNMDFVKGIKQLLYSFSQPDNLQFPIISREEFLLAMDSIKNKAKLSDTEIIRLMERADLEMKNQIALNPFCNYLYFLIHEK